LSKERLGAPIAHDPGTYLAKAGGPRVDQPDQLTTTLEPGDSVRVTLKVTVRAPGTPAPVQPAPELATSSVPSEGASALRTAGWVAVGVGAASLAGAVASLIERQAALTDMNNTCTNQVSSCRPQNPQDALDEYNRGKTASTLLTVFGVLGAVGVVGGTALVLAGHPRQPQAAITIGPAGLSAAGTF